MSSAVLLTGATGFLGRDLLKKLIDELPTEQTIYCLIRGHEKDGSVAQAPTETARARLRKLLTELGYERHDDPKVVRVCAISGDISHQDLGAQPGDYETLVQHTSHIYHGAATVRFDLPLPEARLVNVVGTTHILDLAERIQASGRPIRLSYIGTAFVAGTRTGRILERELTVEQSFHNTYEQTKAEAEALVRRAMREKSLCATLFRPSIIVGNSKTGETSSFKVMYWPLKVFSRGLIPIVPASRAGIVDMVPVDYVIAAIWELSRRSDTIGGCYHLAAGPDASTTIGAALDQAAAFFRVRKPLFVPIETFERYIRPLFHLFFRGKRRQALDAGRVYVPYLNYQASFDTQQTKAALAKVGIFPPLVMRYFETLMQFCIDSDWGKRDPSHSASRRTSQ